MRLLDLQLRNFASFKRAKLTLCDAGLVSIEGVNRDDASAISNGSGKSSLIDALVWCLYGVTTHEPSADGDEVVNERIAKNCAVSCRFDVEGTIYVVTRRRKWKQGGKAVQLALVRHESNGDGFDISKGTIKDTQSEIVKLLGMSLATFRTSCIFGQGRAYRFSRLTDGEKKAVLDEMLGSALYARASERASIRLADSERSLDRLQVKGQQLDEAILDARTALRTARERAKEHGRKERKERTQNEAELAVLQTKLAKVELPKVERIKLSKVTDALDKARDALREARNWKDDSTDAIEALEARTHKLKKLTGTTCVTCDQPIDKAHTATQRKTIEAQIEEHREKLTKGLQLMADVETKVADLQSQKAALEDALEKHRDVKRVRDRLEDKIELLKERLKKRSSVDYDTFIKEARERLESQKTARKANRIAQEKTTKFVAQLKFWREGFGAKGLRSLLLDSTLPFLNAKLETYANTLTAGNIEIEFRTQRKLKSGKLREDFHIHVTNKHGSSKYALNSIGERAKIDIIVGLALQDMAASRSRVPINVAFFDECFEGLDAKGVDGVVNLLSQLERESAFVISHNEALKAFFNRSVRVVKEGGFSHLE